MESIGRPHEMVAPAVLAWVEEWSLFARVWINGNEAICFSSITMKARQCEVIAALITTESQRDDMIDGETNVLPLF